MPLNSLNGSNGFRVYQSTAGSYYELGYSVASGDINGDGVQDLVFIEQSGSYGVVVMFGHTGAWPASIDLATTSLNGSNGFTISPSWTLGHTYAVTTGNINGATYNRHSVDDLIFSMPGADSVYGRVYVVFGGPGPKTGNNPDTWSASWSSTFDVSTINGTNGFYVTGNQPDTALGFPNTLATGDINGDGTKDLIFSDSGSGSFTSQLFVIFGKAGSWASPVSLGTNVTGAANNGSGAIRLTVNSTSNISTGNSLWVYGVTGTTEANGTWTVTVVDGTHLDLQASTFTHAYTSGGVIFTPTSTVGVDIVHPTLGQGFGGAVATGDVNGDGITDMVVTCNSCSSVYIIPGATSGWSNTDVETMKSGGKAYRIDLYDRHRATNVAVGDISGDGIADILIGAQSDSYSSSPGHAFMVFGSSTLTNRDLSVTPLTGTDGFKIDCVSGKAYFTYNCGVASAIGDINNDGAKDWILADEFATATGQTYGGWVYTVFGWASKTWPSEYSMSTITTSP